MILATLASLSALHLASPVFIPLLLGVTLSYALSPLVDRMVRFRMPRVLGAGLLLGSIGGSVGWTAYAQKRITVQVLDEVTAQIHRYLLVQVFTSALVGLVTWGAFAAIGLEQAAVWGVAAFVLNFIPYFGTILLTAAAALVAFVQLGSLNMAFAVAGIALGLHTVTGNLLTPWLTSRTSRLNAVSVFVGVLAFGWLWGVWGLLLGVPILTTVKAVCDRVDDFKPIGELLGR